MKRRSFLGLVGGVGAYTLLPSAANANAGRFRVTTTRPRRYKITISGSIEGSVGYNKVRLFAPLPPGPETVPSQKPISTVISANGKPLESTTIVDPNGNRSLIQVELNLDGATSSIPVTITYEVELSQRGIEQGIPRTIEGTPLTIDSGKYLTSGPKFEQWVEDQKLRMNGTDPLDIMWTCHQAVQAACSYYWEPTLDRSLDTIISTRRTDCGGGGILFTATTRVNNLVTNPLLGLNVVAESGKPNWHMITQTWVPGMGLVPNDPTPPQEGSARQNTFGQNRALFFALHAGLNLLYPCFGVQPRVLGIQELSASMTDGRRIKNTTIKNSVYSCVVLS